LVYVANWPERRSHAWKTLLQARAIENQCYVVGVNRVGNDGNNIYHSGDSMIVDPLGELLYSKKDEEDVFTISLDKEHLNSVRTRLPFLKDADGFIITASPNPSPKESGVLLTEGGAIVSDSPTNFIDKKPTSFLSETKNPLSGGRGAVTFAMLLEKVAQISPLLRVRFSTSHPKDITDNVLYTIARNENVCNYIHLPVQSGSNRVLQLMNRTYTREWYLSKVDRIREIIPGCGISSDIITGFCTEDETDHLETLAVMEYSKYDYSYMFFYSERPGTLAQKRYRDDVPHDI